MDKDVVVAETFGFGNSFGYQIPDLSKINFSDQSNYVHLVVIVNAVFMGLIVVLTSARIYARAILADRFQADDVLIIAAAVASLACSSLILYSIRLGLGYHIWHQDLTNFEKLKDSIGIFAKVLNHGAGILYSLSLNLVKCSIVIFYIRVFPGNRFRRILYGLAFILVASFLLTLFIVIFHCSPRAASWDWTITDAKCLNLIAFLQTMAGVNVVTDVILAVAPIPMIWNLNMSKRERLAVASLVALASLALSSSGSDSYITNTGYLYADSGPIPPQSPQSIKREWGYDTMTSSNFDRFSAEPMNWDDYWRHNIRDDVSAPIDKDVRRKVESESVMEKTKEKSASSKGLSLSTLIPMDTFRRPSASSSYQSRDEVNGLRRETRDEPQAR
ncbi:hypothetical protein DRE_01220 [Drechslerella stenobrocha 248]|uniref:Rhodopsin domain-containing protein n=1 Tax=Drechslerella stenobrocha 248 TaxID=1043628 RepID=W7HMQ8_9PEZI|nr:hypothetical protein DRE_01220 [Drechslerella stenobrocha 248]